MTRKMATERAPEPRKGRLVIPLAAGLLAAGLLSAGCGTSEASQEPSREDRGEAPAADAASYPVPEVAREIEPSVVQVNVSTIQTTPYGPQEAEGLGSGVVYREDGHIITNAHVVGAPAR